VPDIHVLHYGIGPSYLGADMVPLTSNVYSKHFAFDYYRKLSLGVDSCAEYILEEDCLADPMLKFLGLEIISEDALMPTQQPSTHSHSRRFLKDCV